MSNMSTAAKPRSALSKADAKARNTNDLARSIIDAEVSARENKTAKLRAARLAMEEQARIDELAAPPVVKPTRAKKAAKK
jgi:hypothetical protein